MCVTPPGRGDLISQLRRASSSIALNIAEGAGKVRKADKKKFYAIARGSTFECAAILDVMKATKLNEPEKLTPAVNQLHEVAAMLTSLMKRFKKQTVAEV